MEFLPFKKYKLARKKFYLHEIETMSFNGFRFLLLRFGNLCTAA